MKKDLPAVERLRDLGLSEHEARAYLALLRKGPASGYRLARLSGIPRPNIYPVLKKLTSRGIVVPVQTEEGTRYAAHPASQMLETLSREMESRIAATKSALAQLEPEPDRLAWNLEGGAKVLASAHSLVREAKKSLLLAVWSNEAGRLAEALKQARERGVDSTVLCLQGCPHECGGCQGSVYRYALAPAQPRWLIAVADGKHLLIAQVSDDGSAEGAETRLEALVTVAQEYIRNAIALAEIVRSLGPALLQTLDARALEALRSSGLSADGVPWYERIYSAVKKQDKEESS